jgi:hypothetical protein
MMCNAFFEISNDPELSAQIKLLVDVIDSAENPYSTWCPWLPNMLMFRKAISAVRMFYIVRKVVNSRKSSGIRRNDIIQQMLDSGESMFEIFGFVLGLSLAGARATGTIGTSFYYRDYIQARHKLTLQQYHGYSCNYPLTKNGLLSSSPRSTPSSPTTPQQTNYPQSHSKHGKPKLQI